MYNYVGLNKTPLKVKGLVNSRNALCEGVKENVPLLGIPEETAHISAILGSDVLKRFGLSLGKNVQGEGLDEILCIDPDELENKLEDTLAINRDLSYEVRLELKKLFREKYLEPVRPDTPRAGLPDIRISQ